MADRRMDHLDDVLADDFAKLGWRAATPVRRPSESGADDPDAPASPGSSASSAPVPTASPGSSGPAASASIAGAAGDAPAPPAPTPTAPPRPTLRTVPRPSSAPDPVPAASAASAASAGAAGAAGAATLAGPDRTPEALAQVATRLVALETRLTEVGTAVASIGRVLNELQAQTRALRQANVEAGAKAILSAERTSVEADVRTRMHAIEQVVARTHLDRSAMGDRLEQLERQLARVIRLLGG